ncbi:MAG TPA: squalene--hopene cyclase [Acidimicrobiales bacterium]|jgi:squalene-hopene/tetraprenyl-beta-curcumene cyclase
MTILAEPDTSVGAALRRATDRLLDEQDAAGWWKGELETNVTMEAEDLLLRQFLGILKAPVAAETAQWIRSQQRPDGTWATFYGGPPDLSTTVEAYVALLLAGEPADAGPMRLAAEFVRGHGGVEGCRVFTRIWLALFGLWPWDALPALPPELILLPPGAPLSIYDFGCWARQTVVALTVVWAHRPVRPLPFGIDELRTGAEGGPRPPVASVAGAFGVIDRLVHAYERLPRSVPPKRTLRRLALARAERWILRRQEADGCWGGIQPPWVYSLLALHLQGYPLDHPVLRCALEGLDRFTIRDHRGRRLEACQSPVWDTALAVIALADAGVDPEAPALVAAAEWLIGEEVRVRGDWSVRRPELEPGGWAFEFANDNYPDVDDTAEVVLALDRVALDDPTRRDGANERAVAWTVGMQCRDGGWGAFDADNTSRLCAALPFCDFGEVTDPPSADVTAHMIEMLAAHRPGSPAIGPAVAWLSDAQEPDGSWFGRWGANHIYGTGAAVPALVAAGVAGADPRIRRAVAWLSEHQNDDGGWGEDLRSYRDDRWRGRGISTASQTAWALLALLAAGEHSSPEVRRAVAWLVETQTSEGTWEEPFFTGTGFPGDFYINYHLYRLVFPVMALGRFVSGASR